MGYALRSSGPQRPHNEHYLLARIDRMVALVVSVYMLIGAKRHDTCVIQDDPELPLGLPQLTLIPNSRLVRI